MIGRLTLAAAVMATLAAAVAGCGSRSDPSGHPNGTRISALQRSARAHRRQGGRVPPLLSKRDVYAADRPGRLSAVVRHFPARIYVPNSKSNTVDEIDPRTFKVIRHFTTGATA